MAPDPGRPDAGDADRVRVDYLAGDLGPDGGFALNEADRAELDELRALLADPTLWAEPPASLEDAVVAAIATEAAALRAPEHDPAARTAAPTDLAAARHRRAERQQRSTRRGWTRPTLLIAAAAAVIAVVAGGILVLRPPAQRTFDVALESTELAPTAAGSAVMVRTDSGWEITLNVTGLPRLDGGRFYQGWLRNADGVLVPIGTFNEGTDVVLWSGVSPEAFPTMTITQEEADGDQASSGQRVMVGTAVEVE